MSKDLREYKEKNMTGFSWSSEQDKYYDGIKNHEGGFFYLMWDNQYESDKNIYENWKSNMIEDEADLWMKKNGHKWNFSNKNELVQI